MAYFFPALGAAVALAGTDKLVGVRGYNRMFSHLGWSRDAVTMAAAAEVVGGLLMIPSATRRIGAAIIAAASAAVLASEVTRHDSNLAVPRGVVLLAALAGTSPRLTHAAGPEPRRRSATTAAASAAPHPAG
jgi:uncharacterized membrane protein YphA (DoxX/SURF4 family)